MGDNNPLEQRYASVEMCTLFSSEHKYLLWRRLWLALAKAEQTTGLPISNEQIEELSKNLEQIDLSAVKKYEKQFRHDVMAHLYAFGELCPKAKGILHLGATSAFITDNADLLQQKEALNLLLYKLVQLIRTLSSFASSHASLPCLGYTHFQPAQPTTVGKRACLWLQDFLLDIYELRNRLEQLRFLGVKGATGTQASFLDLFNGDHGKVKKLDSLLAEELGFTGVWRISGQTYTRKQDMLVGDTLCGIASSCHKMANDLRLLAHLQEIEEPFKETQVGSSAMPYKRNPILSERICSLARYLLSLGENPRYTAALQWLERSLDDSANRRLWVPQAFLCCDALLNLCIFVVKGSVVYPKVIQRHLDEELPFLAMETILMHSVQKGGDRQVVHEALREQAQKARQIMKESGESVTLLERLKSDKRIPLNEPELEKLLDAKAFTGRAAEQVSEFLQEEVRPLLDHYSHLEDQPIVVEF